MLLLALLLAARTASAAGDEQTLEVYSLMTPDAAAMISLVESVIGNDGKVIYDKAGSRLLVLTTPALHQRVDRMLDEVNVPAPNVRVDVVIDEAGRMSESGLALRGSGDVTISDEGTDTLFKLHPSVKARSTTHDRSTAQSLLVQSGSEAAIKVGTVVPFEEWIVSYGRHHGYITQHVEMQEVGSQLRVQARVIGDGPLISLKLTPELSGLVEGTRRTIAFTQLSTDLTVRDGQSVSLGGGGENTEFYDKFLVGFDRRGERRELNITVTPRIERMAP